MSLFLLSFLSFLLPTDPQHLYRHRRRQRVALGVPWSRTRARQGAHLPCDPIAPEQSSFLSRRRDGFTASSTLRRGRGWEETDHRAREEIFRVGDGEDGGCAAGNAVERSHGLFDSSGALVSHLRSSLGADPPLTLADRANRPLSRLHHPIPHRRLHLLTPLFLLLLHCHPTPPPPSLPPQRVGPAQLTPPRSLVYGRPSRSCPRRPTNLFRPVD